MTQKPAPTENQQIKRPKQGRTMPPRAITSPSSQNQTVLRGVQFAMLNQGTVILESPSESDSTGFGIKPSDLKKAPAERVVKYICRATRRYFSAEDKIRIVLDGLRGEGSITELCRRKG